MIYIHIYTYEYNTFVYSCIRHIFYIFHYDLEILYDIYDYEFRVVVYSTVNLRYISNYYNYLI